jgi:hypothetical protein
MRSSQFDDRYKFEVQIAQTNKAFEAVTYSYLSTIFYGKAAAIGTVNAHTGKVLLQEGKLLEVRNQSGDVCIMTCFLQYMKSGDEEFLEGTYVSMNIRDSSNCGRGTVFLRKVPESDFYKEPFLVKKEKEEKPPVAPDPKKETARTAPPVKKPVTTPKTGGTAGKGLAKTGTRMGTARRDSATARTGRRDSAIARTGAGRRDSVTARTARRDSATARTEVAKTAKPPARPRPAERPEPVKNPPPMAKLTMPNMSTQRPNSDSNGIGRHFPTITPRVLLTRSNQVVKTITVHANEITLNIYDDGAIDHDTVSVYLDNKIVINHAMLTDRPLILTLHLDESNDYHELVMVAENEGEIPPNTSLMIVKAGDKEYEVRITSTEQKNAVVTFKYVK